MNIPRNLKIKIALIAVGVVLIASGVFLVATKSKPSSGNSGPVTVFQEVATESTKAKKGPKKETSKKEDSQEEVKGTTQYVSPKNYQPTAESKATTKKIAEVKQTIEKPPEQTPPDISDPSPNGDHSFSDEHILGYNNTLDEIEDVTSQMDTKYLQLLELERKYYNLPETLQRKTVGTWITQSQFAKLLEVEEQKILREYNILALDYDVLEYRLN